MSERPRFAIRDSEFAAVHSRHSVRGMCRARSLRNVFGERNLGHGESPWACRGMDTHAARATADARLSPLAARSRTAGFTLLEVLIALLILSLVLVALIRAAGLQAHALAHHRDSTLAQWVAANVAADLRAEGAPSIGRQQGESRMGAQRWRWQAETSDTDVERVRRIEITVYEAGADSLSGSQGDPVARLTAFATP